MSRVVPLSWARTSWVLRAMRAEKSVGSAKASSKELVWSDWVCPCVAAIASMQVRPTLFITSWAVSDQPDVWEWVRKESERGSFGAKVSCISLAQTRRPARNFAISVKTFMPIAQKKDRRGAKRSIGMPAATPARAYSIPSAIV